MNMDLNVYAPMLLCLVPLVATFLLLAILLPGISVLREFLAVLAGLLAFVPIVILQFLFLGGRLELFMRTNLFLSIIHSLVFFGLIEEVAKTASLLVLKARGENLRNFFAYSILAGMALGCFESVVYLLTALGTRPQDPTGFLRMIFLRMGSALVIHALCAGLGGLCVFYSKNIRRNFSPLVFAIVIHGIYDFFAAFASSLKYFSVAVILLGVLECRIFYLRTCENLASKKSVSPHSPNNSDSEKTIVKHSAPGKAAEKTAVKKTAATKKAIEKKAATVAAAKKSVEKTIVKKPTKKSATKSISLKNNSANRAPQISPSNSSAAKSKSVSEKKSLLKNAAQTKNASEKAAAKNSASKKSAGKTSTKKTAATKKTASKKKSRL